MSELIKDLIDKEYKLPFNVPIGANLREYIKDQYPNISGSNLVTLLHNMPKDEFNEFISNHTEKYSNNSEYGFTEFEETFIISIIIDHEFDDIDLYNFSTKLNIDLENHQTHLQKVGVDYDLIKGLNSLN